MNTTSPNLVRTWGDHDYTRNLFHHSDTLLHFQTQTAQSWVMMRTTPNFTLFDPLWKLEEGWARSLYQWLKLYLRPNRRNIFDGHQLRGCWARCIDKQKKKKKESSWVKLKAFPTETFPRRLLEHWPQAPASITCYDIGYTVYVNVYAFVIVDWNW